MDLILKNAILLGTRDETAADIGIAGGNIVAIETGLSGDAEILDMNGRLAIPGFVESHIHLDKACILDRCKSKEGTLDEAIREVSAAKKAFTVEDIRARAIQTLEKCIFQCTTRMRTHLEVDTVIVVAYAELRAQEAEIQTVYATQKGACGQGPQTQVEISQGRIIGPGFNCSLSDGRPAGTDLVAYNATCTVDGKKSTKGIALDLGNYKDHFKLSLPDRKNWLALYPCMPVPWLK